MDKKEYRQIAEQSASGDATAFAKLYRLVYRDMYYSAFYTLKDDNDAINVVTMTARECFEAISGLRTEQQFRFFMMKTLCANMKAVLRQYTDDALDNEQPEIKEALFELKDDERMVLALNIAGKCTVDDIAAFMGMTRIGVKKRLDRAKQKLDIED